MLLFSHMKHSIPLKPTAYHLISGRVISTVKNRLPRKQYSTPRHIGKYILTQEVKKLNDFQDYAVGIYSYKKEKVFIKTWLGKIKDLEYYLLLNEYINGIFFAQKLQAIHTSFPVVCVPKPLEVIKSKNALSV